MTQSGRLSMSDEAEIAGRLSEAVHAAFEELREEISSIDTLPCGNQHVPIYARWYRDGGKAHKRAVLAILNRLLEHPNAE